MFSIQMVQEDSMTFDEDERLFTIFESTTGQSFIQPTNHKGNKQYLTKETTSLTINRLTDICKAH